MSKDPILFGGGQANLYVYVGNDPVNHRDPLGLRDWSDDEVQELLRGYAARLDQSPLPMLLMANQHRGNKLDDGTGGIKAWKEGIAPLGPVEYLADSVDYIDRGLYWGLKEIGHY